MPRNHASEGASVEELEHAAHLAVATDRVPRPSSPRPLESDDEALLISPRLSEAAEQADLGAESRRRRRGSSLLSSDGLRSIRARITSASSHSSPLFSTSSTSDPATPSSVTASASDHKRAAAMMKAISAIKPKTSSSSSDSNKPKRKPRPVAQRKSIPTPALLSTPSPALSRSNSFESSSTGSSPPSRTVDLFPGPTKAEEIELARAQDVGRLWRTIVVEENDLAGAPSLSKGRPTPTPPNGVLLTPST